ncbi:MAG: hypothetical protein JXA00_04280 [Candidatus Thermoplasmatota archaeon]|nr:hypothetical protein [Candidatus Thermoplasmatota archaeon]
MKTKLYKKSLTISLVLMLVVSMLVSAGATRDITGTLQDEEETEIQINVCFGSQVKSHAVTLSRTQADVVNDIADRMEQRLQSATTREETLAIFDETLNELYTHHILSKTTVDEAQKILQAPYQKNRNGNLLQKSTMNTKGETGDLVFFCLVAGKTTRTTTLILPLFLSLVMSRTSSRFGVLFHIVRECEHLMQLQSLKPFCLGTYLEVGRFDIWPNWYPASGWIFALNPLKFDGQWDTVQSKVVGFTGIQIIIPELNNDNPLLGSSKHFYLGFALAVSFYDIW